MRKIILYAAIIFGTVAEAKGRLNLEQKTTFTVQSPRKKGCSRQQLIKSYFGKGGCRKTVCFR